MPIHQQRHLYQEHSSLPVGISPATVIIDPKFMLTFLNSYQHLHHAEGKVKAREAMKPMVVQEKKEEVPSQQNQIFGRGAYHVAIAYHIHLK